MVCHFRHSLEYRPGSWKHIRDGDGRVIAAKVTCPHCGNSYPVKLERLDIGGKIERFVCPDAHCFFVAEVELEGWGSA